MIAILLSICFALVSVNAFGQSAVSTMREVPSITVLKTLNTLSPQQSVNVKGWLNPGDGGGGVFELDPASTVPDDGGIWIAPNTGFGRWHRKLSGRDFIARWWGPEKTNATLQAAINWVSANGYGKVIADGGTWTVKSDDSTRILMKNGVTLVTAEDSQIVCAPDPADSWILIDFPLDSRDWTVGPATLVGWNLTAPGGDTNKTGVIFSAQDTHNGTIGGIKASNWYNKYADIGSGNENLQMFDRDWQLGAMSFGATGLGPPYDDTRNIQDYVYFCERYGREFFFRSTTNGYYIGTGPVWITNGIPLKMRGESSAIKVSYYNPTEGTLPHLSSAFIITANNCVVDGFDFRTVDSYPVTETNASITGFFVPLVVHMATNTIIKNCTFSVESGKGIALSGASYTKVFNNVFNDCGLSTGNGHYPDWLYYEAAVPIRGGPSRSPIGCIFTGNTFNRGSPYKHTLFLSAADDFMVADNHFVDMNTLTGPLVVYSGDEGTTDERGTNVYKVSGTIRNNFISGTNFGTEAAIWVRLGTPTNYVPSTFNPSNMYSAITIEGNHINGGGLSGRGIEILSAQGTKIINNDIRVGGNPIYQIGNCNDLLVDGGHYEATNASTGSTFHFGVGFEQPSQFKRVTYRNATLISPPGDECMFRNVEPLFHDSFRVQNCEIIFNGAIGAGDYPQLYQFTQSTNFIDFSYNKIKLGPAMNARRIGLMTCTNADMIFRFNQVMVDAPTVKRGPYFSGRRAIVQGNDAGCIEMEAVMKGLVQGNVITSQTNTVIPVDVYDSGMISVIGNTIENLHTNNITLMVSMGATNSVVYGNLIEGYSSSEMVRSVMGKMYESDNVIINHTPGGLNYVTTNAPGSVAHSVFERSVYIEGSPSGPMIRAHRAGGGASWELESDNYFNSSTRDILYRVISDVGSDIAGHAFFLNTTSGSNVFGFGMTGQKQFIVGQTNSFTEPFIFVSGGGGSLGNAYMRIMSTNTTGTRDAGIVFYVPNAGGNDSAGQIFFRAKQTNGTDTTFAKESAVANDGGFTKRGKWIIQTADINGTLQTALSADYQQNVTVAGRVIIGTGAQLIAGTGNPESAVAAPVGSLFYRTDGSSGIYNKTNGTGTIGWALLAGTGGGTIGDVVGPASSTDNQLALFSSTTGKLLKNTSVWTDNGTAFAPTTDNARDVATAALQARTGYFGTGLNLAGLLVQPKTTGTPEGSVTADSGSLILRKDGGADSSAYIKVSGDGTSAGYNPIMTQDAYVFICGDETTAMTTGTKRTKRIPFGMIVTDVRAELVTAQASGSIFEVDVKESGSTILSTLLTIDNTETTSTTAVTPFVLSDTSLAANAQIAVSVTQVGNGTAAGLTVTLIGHR